MKKLSEIGHTREPEVLIVALQMLEEKHREELLTLLTPAERRELVSKAIRGWESRKWHTTLKMGGSIEIEEFCEEQGI